LKTVTWFCRPAAPALPGRCALAAALLCLAAAAAACNPRPPDAEDYVARITAARAEKDQQFQREREPVPADLKGKLLPLEYFPINEGYAVPAVLKRFETFETVDLVTSTGSIDKYDRVGHLEFVLNGQQLRLTAYVATGQPVTRLFVPFSDLTSGEQTYQTGRYLDLDRTGTGLYLIDFNLAYNPYCYFSPTYICPLPTQENRLPVRIEAGERVKPGKSQT
jgi:uncharacterized protein (DUF1684 family)